MELPAKERKLLDEFKGYLKIDKFALDKEITRQPELFYEVAQIATEKAGEADAAKLALEQAFASISLDIREDFLAQGKKATEGLILQTTKNDKDYITFQDEYLLATHLSSLWSAQKESFNQRSFMLKNMVSLYCAGYYQDTSIKGSMSDLSDVSYEQRKDALTEKRNSKV